MRLGRIRRVVLTADVSRTLFEEYAAHRATDRGAEETGWVLLGLREAEQVTVLATLPAGAGRDAGEAHVRFNSDAQALGSTIARQADRRLTTLGVVHTHPGTLRHPSPGDFRGDKAWTPNLRGGEGVFGIGTVAGKAGPGSDIVGQQPDPHAQLLGGLRFDWYTLAADDSNYQPVPIELVLGPDLARPLRPVWEVIEANAGRLARLARQFARVRFDVSPAGGAAALVVTVETATPGEAVRVLLQGKSVQFVLDAGGDWLQPDLPAGTAPDHGVYLLLAELAARA